MQSRCYACWSPCLSLPVDTCLYYVSDKHSAAVAGAGCSGATLPVCGCASYLLLSTHAPNGFVSVQISVFELDGIAVLNQHLGIPPLKEVVLSERACMLCRQTTLFRNAAPLIPEQRPLPAYPLPAHPPADTALPTDRKSPSEEGYSRMGSSGIIAKFPTYPVEM